MNTDYAATIVPPTVIDEDDETDWEEVDVDQPEEKHLEITLQLGPGAKGGETARRKGITHAERVHRITCHKFHTLCLLANAWTRNKWINDELLHARLLSLTPLHLQNAFFSIQKKSVPDPAQRGRMFENAVLALAEWWANEYFEVVPEGHLRSRTYEEVQARLVEEGLLPPNETLFPPPEPPEKDSKGRDKFKDKPRDPPVPPSAANIPDAIDTLALQDILDDDGELLRSEANSLMKRALVRDGSRDVSAQLFTALCRALGIPARLVVSLQSVPWQAGVGKPKPSYPKKGKGKRGESTVDGDSTRGVSEAPSTIGSLDGTGTPSPTKGKGKEKEKSKPAIRLRKSKSTAQKSDSSPAPSKPLRTSPSLSIIIPHPGCS